MRKPWRCPQPPKPNILTVTCCRIEGGWIEKVDYLTQWRVVGFGSDSGRSNCDSLSTKRSSNVDVIPQAVTTADISNNWNFGFKSDFTCSLKSDFNLSRQSSMTPLKWQNVSWYQLYRHFFLVNFHKRSIKFNTASYTAEKECRYPAPQLARSSWCIFGSARCP